MNNRASIKVVVGAGGRGGEHVGENGGLPGYKIAVDAECCLLSDKDEVAVIEPELGVALDMIGVGVGT